MRPTILIINPRENERRELISVLEDQGYHIDAIAGGDDTVQRVLETQPDLIVLDAIQGSTKGIECCRALQGKEKTRHIPIILVTGHDDDEEHVVTGLNSGAFDFVVRPLNGPVVRARVRAALRSKLAHDRLEATNNEIRRLARALESTNRELSVLALHDSLTGLPNRLLFRDRLEQAIRRSRREPNWKFALLFLDLDRFKSVNDTLGHGAGDRLLMAIAERLSTELRDVDTVAAPTDASLPSRLGGDEFVIILEGLRDADDAEHVAKRLLTVLANPYDVDGHQLTTTASIGVIRDGQNYESAEALLRDADRAMYRAKEQGKDRYVVLDPPTPGPPASDQSAAA